jgi:hypothetical protein
MTVIRVLESSPMKVTGFPGRIADKPIFTGSQHYFQCTIGAAVPAVSLPVALPISLTGEA